MGLPARLLGRFMDYLKLFRGGSLKLFISDDEKVKTFNYQKKGDKWQVVNRETKEKFLVDTEEQALAYRVSETEIQHIYSCLRRGITLEEGVTVGDFLQMIQENEYLEYFVAANFPLYNGVYNSLNPELLSIRRIACVTDGEFSSYPTFDMGPHDIHTPDAVISLDKEMDFYIENEKVWSGDRYISLIDLIEIMFSRWKSEDVLHLSKEGLFCNGEVVDDPIGKFYMPVEVDEDFTVRDLFNYVEDNEDLKSFIAIYSWCGAIDEFHKELNKPLEEGETCGCDYALIENNCELQKLGNYGNTFNWNSEFVGIGPLSEYTKKLYDDPAIHSSMPETERFGLSYVGVNTYAHLPLKVEKTIDISKHPHYGRKGLKEAGIEYGKFKYIIPFGELLDTLYDDISFHGGPEDRDEIKNGLKKTMEEIETGLEESVPFDELLDKLEEEKKEEFGDDYEADEDNE
jgi:hypothetical protein